MRDILAEDKIHADIRAKIAGNQREILDEVQDKVAKNKVVVVGMIVNPHVKRARAALSKAGIAHKYLEYGGYHNMWRRRNALKMWTGWPTFPMVFVDGVLIGGANETEKAIAKGEIG